MRSTGFVLSYKGSDGLDFNEVGHGRELQISKEKMWRGALAIMGIILAIIAATAVNIRQTASVESRLTAAMSQQEVRLTNAMMQQEARLSNLMLQQNAALESKIAQVQQGVDGSAIMAVLTNEKFVNDIDHLYDSVNGRITKKGQAILTPAIKALFEAQKKNHKTPEGLAASVLGSIGSEGVHGIIKMHQLQQSGSIIVLFYYYANQILR